MKKTERSEKVASFFKHNAYYLIMGVCLIAIITMVSVAVVGLNKQGAEETIKPSNPVVPDVDEPVIEEIDTTFMFPVSGGVIKNDYSDENSLHYNPILDEYSFHSGVDIVSENKSAVLAVLDGEVVASKKHKMYGNIVVIKHAKDIVTIYRSLDDLKVKQGDKVKKGDVIGYTSASDISESNLGCHVHFEVEEAGKNVNPNKYLVFEEK